MVKRPSCGKTLVRTAQNRQVVEKRSSGTAKSWKDNVMEHVHGHTWVTVGIGKKLAIRWTERSERGYLWPKGQNVIKRETWRSSTERVLSTRSTSGTVKNG
jgi:hypothetical protein